VERESINTEGRRSHLSRRTPDTNKRSKRNRNKEKEEVKGREGGLIKHRTSGRRGSYALGIDTSTISPARENRE